MAHTLLLKTARLFAYMMSLGFIVLSGITLIPSVASKANRLGYYSVCSFVPYSTATLLTLGAISFWIGYHWIKKRIEFS